MRRLAPLAAALLAACADGGTTLGEVQKRQAAAASNAEVAKAAQPGMGLAPNIYMALQPDKAGPLSVVFAIDAARDGTPDNDPAIRITPLDGKCNPQDLRSYAFPAGSKPVFGPADVAAGVTPRELPTLMATRVSAAMIDAGLVRDVDASKPQNICTFKLWQQMVVAESKREG